LAHVRLYVRKSPEHAWARAGNCWCAEEAVREATLLLEDVRRWPGGQIGAKVVGEELSSEIFLVWPRPQSGFLTHGR
jgi:hypothetical protein